MEPGKGNTIGTKTSHRRRDYSCSNGDDDPNGHDVGRRVTHFPSSAFACVLRRSDQPAICVAATVTSRRRLHRPQSQGFRFFCLLGRWRRAAEDRLTFQGYSRRPVTPRAGGGCRRSLARRVLFRPCNPLTRRSQQVYVAVTSWRRVFTPLVYAVQKKRN